ncbi:MAG: hypothetical protein ACR2QK_10375 [Acidimicrobiales bacterium]
MTEQIEQRWQPVESWPDGDFRGDPSQTDSIVSKRGLSMSGFALALSVIAFALSAISIARHPATTAGSSVNSAGAMIGSSSAGAGALVDHEIVEAQEGMLIPARGQSSTGDRTAGNDWVVDGPTEEEIWGSEWCPTGEAFGSPTLTSSGVTTGDHSPEIYGEESRIRHDQWRIPKHGGTRWIRLTQADLGRPGAV